MRLISVRAGSETRLGVQAGDRWLPADDLVADGPTTMDALLRGGREAVAALGAAYDVDRIRRDGRPVIEADLLAPVGRPGKVVAIGRNYRDHAAEEGVDPPPAPLVFAKWPSAIVGPGADIRWDPGLTAQVDYEAELAVVIGRPPAGCRRRTPSATSSATPASMTSRRATSSSATASGRAASPSTRSARSAPRS